MTLAEIRAVPAIDFHAHFGRSNVNPKYQPEVDKTTPSQLSVLQRNNRYSNIALSIVSHLLTIFPRGGGTTAGNDVCRRELEGQNLIYMLVTLDPTAEGSFEQTERFLQDPRCLGIKIHPEEHRYPITRYGNRIFEFAAKHKALVVTHSGEGNSMPEEFAILANMYPEVTVVTSHMGCGWDGNPMHQARAIEMSTHGNLYTDTSSAQSMNITLLENYVAAVGSDRILFGTDSGCYAGPAQRARVDCADISDEDKLNILYRNGLRIRPELKALYEAACAEFVCEK